MTDYCDEPQHGCCYKPYQFMALEEFAPEDDVGPADVINALKEHTTSTGLPHIHHARGPVKKGCWIVITLGALVGLSYNLYQLGYNYSLYAVNVNINVKNENQMTFPSVTICNMCPVKQSKLAQFLSNGGTVAPAVSSVTSKPEAAGGKRRRKRSAGGSATAVPGSTTANSTCCCSCCFSSAVAGQAGSCNCGANQFPYNASSCPAPSAVPGIAANVVASTMTTAPPTTSSATTTGTTTAPLTTSSKTTTGLGSTGWQTGAGIGSSGFTSGTTSQSVTTGGVGLSTARQLFGSGRTTGTTAGTTAKDRPIFNNTMSDAQLTELLAGLPLATKVDLGFSATDLIIDCVFEGYTCYPTTFATFFNEILGNCYIFNAGWNTSDEQVSKKTGRRHGLQLTMNVNQDEYIMQGDDTAGIRVVVHERLRMPFPEDEGLALNPGESTSIGLNQVNIERQPAPYGPCVDPTIIDPTMNVYEELYPGVQYSAIACMRTCYQNNMIQTCGCGDPGYPLYGKAFGYTVDKPAPSCSLASASQQACMVEVNAAYSNNSLNCNCPDSCSDIDYVTGLSIGQWPSNVQKQQILTTLQPLTGMSTYELITKGGYQDNLIKLEMFFESFDYQLIEEVPAYPFTNLLADSGGVLGLWLGASMLTMFEFVEFGIDMTILGIIAAIRKMKKPSADNKVQNVNIKQTRSHSIVHSRPTSQAGLVDNEDPTGRLDTPGLIH